MFSREWIDTGASRTFFARAVSVREEAKNLIEKLREVEAIREIEKDDERRDAYGQFYNREHRSFTDNIRQIDSAIDEMKQEMRRLPSLDSYFADGVTRADNAALDVRLYSEQYPSSANRLDFSAFFDLTERLIGKLQQLKSQCEKLSAIHRIRIRLPQMNVGGAMDFHEWIKDEVELEDDRKLIFQYLVDHPRRMPGGRVDASTGLIFRVRKTWIGKCAPVALMGTIPIIGLVIAYLLARHFPEYLANYTAGEEADWPSIRLVYLSVILGSLVHLLVDFFKQERSNQPTTITGLSHWLIWIQMREEAFVKSSFILVAVALVIVIFETEIDLTIAFLAGYFFDSAADIFLLRFSNFTTAGQSKLKTILSK